ncbi:hypothetical protein [Clostridium sp. BL-8]|uniref:hypothetical protein n=1 Tax=Clostridium sp. BL-8 TaxID=349938 RepID=UPI00098C362F|nr:hypothetical protein [Clostridium sp. BL-8]OOM79421.1 hypothetical protein CLOBL_15950 [Clostridium sp. BL-8]
MNYRTHKTSKLDLINYNFNKNIIHDLVSKNLLNISKHFVNRCKSFLNFLFAPTSYVYDDASDTFKSYNDRYYFRDITDLKLKASQRTFL